MPKSKRRKPRYTPRARQQPAVSTQTQSIVKDTTAVIRPPVTGAPAAKAPSTVKASAAKALPTLRLHVGTELKVIGIITAIILVAIIALYFVLR